MYTPQRSTLPRPPDQQMHGGGMPPPTQPGYPSPGMPPIGNQAGVPQPGMGSQPGQQGPQQNMPAAPARVPYGAGQPGFVPGGRPSAPVQQQPQQQAQNPLSPWPATSPVTQAMPPQAPGSPGGAGYSQGTSYGGQNTVGAQAGPADYQGVQQFSDAAYDNSRRYLDPAQDAQNRRFEQQLMNKGIDPLSAVGMEMANQLAMQHGDQNNAAAFDAMGFGQGVQDQMFGQSLANTQQAGNMQQAQWNNQNNTANRGVQKYGMDQNYNLGKSGQDLQRYGMDQNYQLGQGQLGLSRQQQDWGEFMDTSGIDFRDAQFNEGNRRFDQNSMMSLFGIPQAGVNGSIDPRNQGNPLAPWEQFGKNAGNVWDNWGG